MTIAFAGSGWSQYLDWQTQDKKMIKKINRIIEDIGRTGHSGIGKPEPLKGNLSGWWSRRIDEKNRLVYRIQGDTIEISQCGGHY
ncbi:MAG: Txe/YoeB family addiction module toxin [Spirochaetia bacterium]|jgi:toxin YoeB|nr:Txe/YoeB family addiction module toxin [Spirochaetia bacterium]